MTFLDELKNIGSDTLKSAANSVGIKIQKEVAKINNDGQGSRSDVGTGFPALQNLGQSTQNFLSGSVLGVSVPFAVAAGLAVWLIARKSK